ncbi:MULTISPECIES: cytochrome c3 family protein [Aeromonas]|jgi:cytochrome c nitrite reductase small subunit|uniref:cytochrome c3 family protein n=1 Tax=Aeromonas aquatica TaxID=558964 RepID=UPI00286F75D3|nr:NapC/NirT family cytochrome c [Aeromonas aquatica]
MNRMKFGLLLACVLGLVSLGISLIGAEVVKATGDERFCGSCHEMKPMVEAYRHDIHGGSNRVGFKAECADCHLPHDNTFNYLLKKATSGLNDVYKVTLTDTSKIDWLGKRDRREEFVYDSGCLSCHQGLLEKTVATNPKSLQMHAHYQEMQQKGEKLQCVSCHVTIGHNGELRSRLNETQPEYQFQHDLRAREAARAGTAK